MGPWKTALFWGFQGRHMTRVNRRLLFGVEVSLCLGVCILGHID